MSHVHHRSENILYRLERNDRIFAFSACRAKRMLYYVVLLAVYHRLILCIYICNTFVTDKKIHVDRRIPIAGALFVCIPIVPREHRPNKATRISYIYFTLCYTYTHNITNNNNSKTPKLFTGKTDVSQQYYKL